MAEKIKELKKKIEKLNKDLEIQKQVSWTINYNNNEPDIIRLTGIDNKPSTINISKIVNNKLIDLFENVFAQADLMYLTGKFKSFKHAYNHIKNHIDYKKEEIKPEVGVTGAAK